MPTVETIVSFSFKGVNFFLKFFDSIFEIYHSSFSVQMSFFIILMFFVSLLDQFSLLLKATLFFFKRIGSIVSKLVATLVLFLTRNSFA